jgi:hypothetical protein
MLDGTATYAIEAGTMTEPSFDRGGTLFESGRHRWATFTREFAPTGSMVTVLVDVADGKAPSSAVGLYCQLKASYAMLLPKIVQSVCSSVSVASATVEQGFKLDSVDLRGHIRPSACVLHYRTDRSDFEFDWYVRVSQDYRVEYCGERD